MQDFYQITGIKPKVVEFQIQDKTFFMHPTPAMSSEEILTLSKSAIVKTYDETSEQMKELPPTLVAYNAKVDKWKTENPEKESTEDELEKAGIAKPKSIYEEVVDSNTTVAYVVIAAIFCMRNSDGVPIAGTPREAYEIGKTLLLPELQILIKAYSEANADVSKNVNASVLPASSEEKTQA